MQHVSDKPWMPKAGRDPTAGIRYILQRGMQKGTYLEGNVPHIWEPPHCFMCARYSLLKTVLVSRALSWVLSFILVNYWTQGWLQGLRNLRSASLNSQCPQEALAVASVWSESCRDVLSCSTVCQTPRALLSTPWVASFLQTYLWEKFNRWAKGKHTSIEQ